MQIFHITIVSKGRLHAFSDEERRRVAVHALGRATEGRCALFCLADEHGHFVVLADRGGAGRLAQAVGVSWGRRLPGVEWLPAHFTAVESRGHARSLVSYVLRQGTKHGCADDDAEYTGSCFHDLVGARLLPGFDPGCLGRMLPRQGADEVWAAVGRRPLAPATDEELGQVPLGVLRNAAAAALGLDPSLEGRSTLHTHARRSFAHLARACGHPRQAVAEAVGVTPQAAGRLARAPVEAGLLAATRLQARLARPGAWPPAPAPHTSNAERRFDAAPPGSGRALTTLQAGGPGR